MAASLPVAILRSPSVIVLERELRYRPIATADVVEALSYYLWSVGTVALGFGVWGIATAVVVRAVAGTATILLVGPLGLVRPRWSWQRVRPVIGFGARYQANAILFMIREQGLTVVVELVGGLATLGVWNLAWRVLQIPNLLFLQIGRISFPTLSRLLGAGHDARPVIERGVAALAALTGLIAAALAGFAPALPSLVGDNWHAIPSVLLWSGIALVVGIPVIFSTTGYLLAMEEMGTVATATIASTAVWFGVAAALLPSVGAAAVGIGWLASGAVHSALLWRRATARSGAAIAARVVGPAAVGVAGAVAGWFVARAVGPPLVGGVVGLVAGELVALAGLAAVSRGALVDLRVLSRQALGTFRRRRPAVASSR
jgi:O-antigen/teichoic acid export membrane protein